MRIQRVQTVYIHTRIRLHTNTQNRILMTLILLSVLRYLKTDLKYTKHHITYTNQACRNRVYSRIYMYVRASVFAYSISPTISNPGGLNIYIYIMYIICILISNVFDFYFIVRARPSSFCCTKLSPRYPNKDKT